MKKTPLNILMVIILFCLLIKSAGCKKESINPAVPDDVYAVKTEIVDLNQRNNLNSAIIPAQWDLSKTVKTTYSNGAITYVTKSTIDPTKSSVTYQSPTGKVSKSIATTYQMPSSTNRFFSLKSVDGKILYYSILADKYNNVIEVKGDDPAILKCVLTKLRWLGGDSVGRLLCLSSLLYSMTACAITAGVFCVFGWS